MTRARTIINHVGPYTLFRYRDGSTSLKLRVEKGGGILRGPDAPKLNGWKCFFIGRHPEFTNFTYRKEAS